MEACRGQGEYDCLVSLSGGKDSFFLLYKIKEEYGSKVLAFTTDLTYWKLIGPLVNFIIRHKLFTAREVSRNLRWLDLSESDLHITKHKGAYAPVIPSS